MEQTFYIFIFYMCRGLTCDFYDMWSDLFKTKENIEG